MSSQGLSQNNTSGIQLNHAIQNITQILNKNSQQDTPNKSPKKKSEKYLNFQFETKLKSLKRIEKDLDF